MRKKRNLCPILSPRHSLFLPKTSSPRRNTESSPCSLIPLFKGKCLLIDSDTLDAFGLRPNQLPDLLADGVVRDQSGLPTIRGPRHSRLSLRSRQPTSTPRRESTEQENSQNTGPTQSDGYPISQARYLPH